MRNRVAQSCSLLLEEIIISVVENLVLMNPTVENLRKEIKMTRKIAVIVAALAWLLSAAASAAEEVDLPRTLAATAYGAGSAGHAQMVSIGNLLKNEYGTSLRIIPGENDVSRMTLVNSGRVPLCSCGIAAYFAQEGVQMFAGERWGPQRLRVIITSVADVGMGLVVAGDVGVKEPKDLKGKRVASIRGGDTQNLGAEAVLAYGGLTWNDVQRVEFPGYIKTLEGIINDQVDAAFVMTVTSTTHQIASSSRGIVWPYMDPDDKDAWARAQNVAPYLQPNEVTLAAGEVSKENPWHGSSYAYPVLLGTDSLDYDIASGLIRVMVEDFDKYKEAAPGNKGYALDRQKLDWIIPFHQAVIDYYKEIGVWTEEHQAHQDQLLKREDVLHDAWQAYSSQHGGESDEKFKTGWLEARAQALKEQGLKAIF